MTEQPKNPESRADIEEVIDDLRADNERGEVHGLALVCFVEDGVKTRVVGRFNPIHMSGHLDLLKAKLMHAEMENANEGRVLH